ncbi:Uncharacterised protein [Bordetella pertussis]|nr:Uncharacterised protein [Bordetella pertussis]CFL75751.1 Uncharacterised protein [Bordetella pertussis]CFL84411.1 Uncharacterised protein [Bordetella pertussis]CFL85222.1 Uncharacterised protein [Bordetella pertussis]CFL90026.1 Uncharacterised protein [Bordetella pertussis]
MSQLATSTLSLFALVVAFAPAVTVGDPPPLPAICISPLVAMTPSCTMASAALTTRAPAVPAGAWLWKVPLFSMRCASMRWVPSEPTRNSFVKAPPTSSTPCLPAEM